MFVSCTASKQPSHSCTTGSAATTRIFNDDDTMTLRARSVPTALNAKAIPGIPG
jgi:hypothetical protein